MTAAPRHYQDIKALASATGLRIRDLLALARSNDPFYISPAQVQQAKWFAGQWDQFQLQVVVHLRRIHYQLVSQPEPVAMVDGRPYQNTELCWQYLGNASKAARSLGLVAADSLKDARNPGVTLSREYPARPACGLRLGYAWQGDPMGWELPRIDTHLADSLDWSVPGVQVDGYEATDHDQPFHLELISEKSTMDDVLVPLCADLRINYAPATGFQSITGAVALLKRLQQANKPGVVFYVSDFDPAGSCMPPAVARQLEYWLPTFAPGLDVLLLPVVLTLEQVRHYRLPAVPIKDTDNRQAGFKERFGVEGATELDALEALHPGELERVLRQAVGPYRDADAEREAARIDRQAERAANRLWDVRAAPHREQLEGLQSRAAAIVGTYTARLEALRDALNEELAPLERELIGLRRSVQYEFDDLVRQAELPDRYASPVALLPPERFDGLFDSRRGYLEQLRFYKATSVTAET